MKLREIKNAIKSTILCIRFPFLYPRNRWTNTHYHNYNLQQFTRKLYSESFTVTSKFEQVVTCHWKYYLAKFLEWYHDYPLQLFHCIPTYTELDAMDKGWRKAFGIQLCKDLRKVLIKNHCLFSYRVVQIKEKWGELCWYDNNYLVTKDILQKYIDLSYRTCIVCGEPATYRTPTESWECPYCNKHIPSYIANELLIKIE